jgi:hypothetical protein
MPIRLLAGCIALAALGPAAHADPISQATLDNVYNGCVESCIQSAPAQQKACQEACGCVSEQIGNLMTDQDLIATEKAVASRQPLTPDLAAKEDEVKRRCAPKP